MPALWSLQKFGARKVVLGQERAGGHDRRLFPDHSVGGPCGLCVSFRRCVFKMCTTRSSISLYLRHYRPGAALYLSLIYVEYIVNQQPRRGRWIESTEPRIFLILSALQKINLIESKLSPVPRYFVCTCTHAASWSGRADPENASVATVTLSTL